MKPLVKKYLNVFQYLQDIYRFRKGQNDSFSYDQWAKELQASDKSYVRLLILGKRSLNEKMIQAFGKNLDLGSEDLAYFSTLVHYTQSRTQDQKTIFGKKMMELLREGVDQFDIHDHYDFISDPLLPKLQVMLSFDDIDHSPFRLSWLMNVSEQEVVSALHKLEHLGLIKSENGRYKPVKRSFKVPDNFKDLGLHAFYSKNLEDARAAIDLPSSERRFKSLFLPLNKSEFESFLVNMQNFVTEQLRIFDVDDYADRRLYQVHMNIIPTSLPQDKRPATEVDCAAEARG